MNAGILYQNQQDDTEIGMLFHKSQLNKHRKHLRERMNGVCFRYRNRRRYAYATDKISKRSDVLCFYTVCRSADYGADPLKEAA